MEFLRGGSIERSVKERSFIKNVPRPLHLHYVSSALHWEILYRIMPLCCTAWSLFHAITNPTDAGSTAVWPPTIKMLCECLCLNEITARRHGRGHPPLVLLPLRPLQALPLRLLHLQLDLDHIHHQFPKIWLGLLTFFLRYILLSYYLPF